MQIKKRIKKGFTLVELVVVIAVIAILAAVSIGAYFGITDSANRSADEQAVTQMNTMLETHEILNGKVDDVEEAKDIFEDNGLTNYTPFYGKNTFYWTYDDSRVIIWEEDKGVTYPSWAVDKYEEYSVNKLVSVDWYNLSEDYINNIYIEDSDLDGEITTQQFLETASTVQNNGTVIFPKDSNLNDMNGEKAFHYWFENLGSHVKTVTVDLNGSTIQTTKGSFSFDNKTVVFENGTIDVTRGVNVFDSGSNASVVLRNMNIICSDEQYAGSSVVFLSSNGSEVVLDNCYISNFNYGVGTNALQSSYVKYTIRNTVIENTNCPLFLNVAGSATVENSKFYATNNAVFVRTGNLSVINSHLETEHCPATNYFYYEKFKDTWVETSPGGEYFGKVFASGLLIPTSVVTLGDYSKEGVYTGDVNATFDNVTFNGNNSGIVTVPHLLLAADNDTSVVVNYSSSCNISSSELVVFDNGTNAKAIEVIGAVNNGTIQINGTLYNYTDKPYNA